MHRIWFLFPLAFIGHLTIINILCEKLKLHFSVNSTREVKDPDGKVDKLARRCRNLLLVSGENFTPQKRREGSSENYSGTPLQFHTDPSTAERY